MSQHFDYKNTIAPFFCHDGNGYFLFYLRSNNTKDEHGKWDCSGGSMLPGEKPEETVSRKLKIQYGCSGEIQEQLPECFIKIDREDGSYEWLAHPFIVKVDRQEVTIGEPEKMEEINWFRLTELPANLHPGAMFILDKYKSLFEKYS